MIVLKKAISLYSNIIIIMLLEIFHNFLLQDSN